ncbi:zinc finger protein interacting with ribonucleoprotein K [Manduca sexta]|uniref:C2H2-type domain-containing protein n=1 Tax=Manduca sexta TaxID=7130 RepID=A0A922C9H0_MANSE|nr:zinc finger protein interacting with ribonucleoprotein K [Manduca sexta]KAG6440585.1 hypothetical protein O3G_MSEX001382 [Manduca sexta]
MDDNDMFLVIVGDETEELQIPSQIQIKEECIELDENLPVEELIEKAEKHGQYIKIGIEPKPEFESFDGNKSQFTHYLNTIKEEKPDYSESDQIGSDNEYSSEEEIKEKKAIKTKRASMHDLDEHESYVDDIEDHKSRQRSLKKKQTKAFQNRKRSSMLRPDKQKSFVEELRKRNPELRSNTTLLVKTLCDIMRNVKYPPLPKHYFVQQDITYNCPQCGHKSETLPAAARHYREKHGPRYLVCYACGVDFRSTTNLYKHEKRCISRDQRIVLMARAAILGNKGRGRPYVKHITKPFQCNECSAEFRSKCTLMSHISLHRGERQFQCHECPAAYTSYSALARHVKKHTDIEYICDHCQKSFKVKVALVAHMDTHRAVRKFGCDLCERRFAQKQALQLHVDRVHRNLPPPHACQICPKRYPRMSLLKTHMKNEHGLTIMTPKMFYKKLPTLTKAEMEQTAKIVFKTDSQLNKLSQMLGKDEVNSLDNAMEESGQNEDNFILPNNVSVEDIIEYYKQKAECEGNVDSLKTLIVKNGEVYEIHYGSEQ